MSSNPAVNGALMIARAHVKAMKRQAQARRKQQPCTESGLTSEEFRAMIITEIVVLLDVEDMLTAMIEDDQNDE
jgi:hypothetical protein